MNRSGLKDVEEYDFVQSVLTIIYKRFYAKRFVTQLLLLLFDSKNVFIFKQ